MHSKYKSKKFLSEGYFFQPFLRKANWTSRHVNVMQKLLNLKVETVGFVWAVPKGMRKISWLLSLIPRMSNKASR